MSVNILVYGADKESDEYEAAVKMKEVIKNTLPDSVTGEIVLYASATLYGQAVKDVDLMMVGNLENYVTTLEFVDSDKLLRKEKVEITNFCTTIEIKRHSINGIFLRGTDFYVKYGREAHCVTLQSNNQKISAMNFFKRTLAVSPYVTNLIWFTQTTKNEINGLLTNAGNKMISNVLSSEFTFDDVIQLLVFQKPPYKYRDRYIFSSSGRECYQNEIRKALTLFTETKEQMGELTRRRIEQISNGVFGKNTLIDTKGKVSIYRGRAGTGKTVGLIQTAIKLVEEEQVRILILTYNKALVSDMRRLFALAELPDMFEINCLHVNTMHSYFLKLVNCVLYNGRLDGGRFFENYDLILQELIEFMEDEQSIDYIKELALSDQQLNWDYLLIDEAQDWTNSERDIVLKLFDRGKIIVADGGQQFVRRTNTCDWSIVKERNNIKLKYCLRQKENIVRFINVYTQKIGVLGGKVLTNGNMPGGKVIIVPECKMFEIHQREMDELVNAGNIAYDMLYLVPSAKVKHQYGVSFFAEKDTFKQRGIEIWDGTNNECRESYSINPDEIRLLQYDSARGLEGWTVVCMNFDVFLEEKKNAYIPGDVDSLLLETPQERKKKYLYNWAMIPLTRAIDTIIITLKNPLSDTGVLLKEIANECRDFVTWID